MYYRLEHLIRRKESGQAVNTVTRALYILGKCTRASHTRHIQKTDRDPEALTVLEKVLQSERGEVPT